MDEKKRMSEMETREGEIILNGMGTSRDGISGYEKDVSGENDLGSSELYGWTDCMGQEPEAEDGARENALPELTEEEIFGEDSGKETVGTVAKPKRASRKKKAEALAKSAGEPYEEPGCDVAIGDKAVIGEKEDPEIPEEAKGSEASEDSGNLEYSGERKDGEELDGDEVSGADENPEHGDGLEYVADPEDAPEELEGDLADVYLNDRLLPEAGEPEGVEEMLEENGVRNEESASFSSEQSGSAGSRRTARPKREEASVLTLEVRGEVETEESREDVIWHEIHNAYRTRRMLTGQLGGIEQTDNGKTIAIVDYKGFRIVIPLKEMMINVGRNPSGQEYAELMLRQNKILGNMLGAEIDFIVKGIDSKTRSVVASRREAMMKKRQIFYLDMDASGMCRIHEGRIVQARVIAVAEKVIRVEVFGVECSIMARDLAWDWIGDAHERFSVGDQVLVKVLTVHRESLDEISVKADVKSVSQNTSYDNLKKCRIQSKYAGKVTDIHKGVVYIRLSNGVNAVAHSCYDYRTPGKKDDVSFAVTRLDEERGVAVGIITRIIRQNL